MRFDRYVILHHRLPASEHWDLLLEQEAALATWQLPRPPNGSDGHPLEAIRIFDHRKKYLDYEGPVSDNRGVVQRHDRGRYRMVDLSDGRWVVDLDGQLLNGRFELVLLHGDRWTFRPAQRTP